MEPFDLAIIGAGPGGFDAALRARELGFKVALIEKADAGGTCLNSGCIPTKSLLASAKLINQITHAESLGLSSMTPKWDLTFLIQRKDRIVEALKKGMAETIKKSGVEWISGTASFVGKNRLRIEGRGNPPWLPAGQAPGHVPAHEIETKNIIIATGSEPTPFPGVPFDGKKILTSSDLLELKTLPSHLLILGGGVVGVEFASIFQALGVKVTIVEMLDHLIAMEDEDTSRRLESIFSRRGIQVRTGTKVKTMAIQRAKVDVILESGEKLEADRVLVAIGRTPCLQGLGLNELGIKAEKGAIRVNEYLETSLPGIFAIGDATNHTTGLAHGATAEGVRIVENLKGPKEKMDYQTIPNCIYTDPEVASVRATPRGCQQGMGLPLQDTVECKILFSSIGKSQVEGETEGFVKMTASKKDGRILKVSAIGAQVTELIHEAALAIKTGVTIQILAQTIHAHPTESEILQKAAQRLRAELSR